ncbi:MAG: hypothetical protein HYR66_02505 [Sphingobacteriales bacterium]|nr:hypothetical protein [Sphingobacteriales bacterium]MBI3718998.1 hypothetical protein [Sphingobacteriales bacterium]
MPTSIFLFKSYNRIRQTALQQNLFKIASDSVGILDVANRTTSPYDAYNIFAFTPFKTTITQFNAVNFSFPASLWETGSISSINIDFADGTGYKSISKNSTISIYYATEGSKTLKAQITIGGSTLTAYTIIQYSRPSVFVQPTYQWSIDTTRIYNNDNDYLGTSGLALGAAGANTTITGITGANVLVEDGCDGVFDKPVIIVEGFDPWG